MSKQQREVTTIMKNFWSTMLVIVLLTFTNPTKDDFNKWVIQQGNNVKTGNAAEAAKMAIISAFASMLLDSAITRSNYIIFSTYTSSANDQCLVIGVFGNFLDFTKEPVKNAGSSLEPEPADLATPDPEKIESVKLSSSIQQQLESVTKTIPPASSETRVEVIISDFLTARNMSLPTIQDIEPASRSAEDDKKFAPLSDLPAKDRIVNVVTGAGDDFAIKCVDFNGDSVKDVFVEVKEGEKRFYLYFFDGAKRTLEPITFSWEIQGTLSQPTQYAEGAYFLSFEDDDKQVLFCHIGYYYWAWLGYVDGNFRNISIEVIDLEGGVEVVECDEDLAIALNSLGEKWAYVSVIWKGTEKLIILPKKRFQSLGFVWGNNVNVRDGYGADYKKKKVLYQFQNGAVVDILGEQDGWFRVKPRVESGKFAPHCFDSNAISQWVKADFIKHVPPLSKNRKENTAANSKKIAVGMPVEEAKGILGSPIYESDTYLKYGMSETIRIDKNKQVSGWEGFKTNPALVRFFVSPEQQVKIVYAKGSSHQVSKKSSVKEYLVSYSGSNYCTVKDADIGITKFVTVQETPEFSKLLGQWKRNNSISPQDLLNINFYLKRAYRTVSLKVLESFPSDYDDQAIKVRARIQSVSEDLTDSNKWIVSIGDPDEPIRFGNPMMFQVWILGDISFAKTLATEQGKCGYLYGVLRRDGIPKFYLDLQKVSGE